ncbi:MAG TPA: alpha/beta hydrolase [Cyanobacteria bacterium UBA11149]|nr:alpha/beta hydrolase [Cyanobacteria bacterium UBA11367]HBE56359.1 alpha/beta hydrolase [Cyanobacteria bacterium UBA11366]HBK64221.1 alpha/beta hydrolase [Cyanobacteria bacterium UBA11166]HBR72786.1 alpha/beta hydrolase [Cyanobacteria bacterium UBA11159]HBS69891.1 alpha/beta hydrolase [Cyanobacteria bacterium UBA11153]HBW91802.1 alpha/beta hydrolase [Cyanobacteria bacterium UBA11149]HCA93770.1 alpha/beta hydrolase [Cyanobacteria bacterium UBA9226]
MPIYNPDSINFHGITGHRYWIHQPFTFTGVADIDERLSGFPVAIFLPQNRPRHQTPLVIGLQGMCAPYGLNAFIIPTLTQMGIAVALFDTPLAGERSLVRTFSAIVQKEIQPLCDRNIPFDTQLILQIFRSTARDIGLVRDLCCDRYNLTDNRLALFGVSMGVLQSAFAFTAHGIGQRLLGSIGHANLQSFAKSWGTSILPELAVSPLGNLAEEILRKLQPDLKSIVPVLRLVKYLKDPDEYSSACNPMTYIDNVKSPRRVRFLIGKNDPLVKPKDAQACAKLFPDGECYVVPGMGHGTHQFGPVFVDHVRYFLATQLGDWQY